MAETTLIEWARATYSLWHGCAKISRGCEFCYAAKNAPRNPGVFGVWGVHGTRVLAADWCWPKLFSWDAKAKDAGERWRVFPSICDPYEEWAGQVTDGDGRPLWYHRGSLDITSVRGIDDLYPPLGLDYLRDYWHALIALTPNLDHLLLTKRPDVAARYYADPGLYARVLKHADRIRDRNDIRRDPGVSNPALPNGYINRWLLASVEDQETADFRMPWLLKCPAAVLGLSAEPLLNRIDLRRGIYAYPDGIDRGTTLDGIGIVIAGGESGPNARPMHTNWPRWMRDQCVAAGVPFFFKQHGEWLALDHLPEQRPVDTRYGEFHNFDAGSWVESCMCEEGTTALFRVGKKAAGRVLDGRTWDQFPEPREAHS